MCVCGSSSASKTSHKLPAEENNFSSFSDIESLLNIISKAFLMYQKVSSRIIKIFLIYMLYKGGSMSGI